MAHLATALAITLLGASAAFAGDGVLEVNQACVATGCFPGDPAGFPVTISLAGSYRLTGNLTLPPNTTGIRIDTSNVTLDLGGFEVKGPNTCTGYPVTGCTSMSGAAGILGPTANEFLVVVRNGKVTGMAGTCIALFGNSSTVEQVNVFYCGGDGIRVGFAGRVAHSFSGNNFSFGINVGDGGMAEGNEARGNRFYGIAVGNVLGGSVIENRALENGSFGIAGTGGGVLLSRNLFSGNVGGSFTGGVLSPGDNVCNGTLC